ncbi:MAG: potD [Bacteriovoracaceae bacterium]|nr:potD [Bacteriovoracaceae bacterium]
MKKIVSALIVISSLLSLGCKQKSTGSSTPEAAQSSKVVNLSIWTNFITPELLSEFEKRTGIKVQVSNYSSNEELLAKIQAGAEGYDVAVPSDYMVVAMNQLGLLLPLDLQKISNYKDLDPRVLKKYYDPSNKVSVPFSWGTTGIAVNHKLTKAAILGWKDLFETKEIAGKFTLLDDVRETLGAALKMQGFSLNTKNPAELEKAKAVLLEAKKRAKGFTSEPLAGLVNGEMVVAHAYSVDALMASQKTQGAVQYVLPVEGCTFWVDNLVIPKGAKNIDAAHQLIDFLLEPKTGAERAKTLFSAPSNKKSFALLSKELQENAGLFPDEKKLAKCEMLEDLGESLVLWDRIWTEVKASN